MRSIVPKAEKINENCKNTEVCEKPILNIQRYMNVKIILAFSKIRPKPDFLWLDNSYLLNPYVDNLEVMFNQM